MPGEKEYMASELGISVDELQDKYLDLLVTPRGVTDVLKLTPGCPFLDSCYHCTAADKMAKPVLCEVYPVVFEVMIVDRTTGGKELDVQFEVDQIDCPLMHLTYKWGKHRVSNSQWTKHRQHFETNGVKALRDVGAPAEWYWIVAQYDAENFDYDALKKIRRVPENRYASVTLDELLSCRVGPDLSRAEKTR